MVGIVGTSLAVLGIVVALCGSSLGQTLPDSTIVSIEREALTLWGNGDPFGYIELASEEISYFDPGLEKRVDGKAAFREWLMPVQGKIHIYRFEMQNTRVQLTGDVAILTFNLVNYDDKGSVVNSWNSTETYRREAGTWKLCHSHWSFTKPDLK